MNAALQLNLTHLHDICCAKIAAFMKKAKTRENIEKEFSIVFELTDEEVSQLSGTTNE